MTQDFEWSIVAYVASAVVFGCVLFILLVMLGGPR